MTIATDYRTANKVHNCANCRRLILPGERYQSRFGMTEDDRRPYRLKLCSACADEQDRRCSYEYVNRVYSVNARPGDRVNVGGKLGTILQPDDSTAHVHVRFDGERRRMSCHPTWMIEYLGEWVA